MCRLYIFPSHHFSLSTVFTTTLLILPISSNPNQHDSDTYPTSYSKSSTDQIGSQSLVVAIGPPLFFIFKYIKVLQYHHHSLSLSPIFFLTRRISLSLLQRLNLSTQPPPAITPVPSDLATTENPPRSRTGLETPFLLDEAARTLPLSRA